MDGGHRVCVVGSGYVGTVVAACLAKLGNRVTGVEIDPLRLESLNAGTPPIYEPGLDELMREQTLSGRLDFTDDLGEAVPEADVIFICVGTPSTQTGEPEMSAVGSAARGIGAHLRRGQVLVTKSTVPIGSGQWLEAELEKTSPNGLVEDGGVSIVSNPEFLREGWAIRDFLYPDRVVLGSDDPPALDVVEAIYRPILEQSFSSGDERRPELVRTDLATAEMIKYAANAFLATKISFINEMAILAERVGADISDVSDAIGLDTRIGRPFLNAGVGWGGSCFGKDLRALAATARDYGIDPLILDAVQKVNRHQRELVVEKLQHHLRSLRGRRIALLGLAFKPRTDDLRDAPAVYIARRLVELGAVVTGYDPVVKSVDDVPELVLHDGALEAAARADAVVLVTDWPEFKDIDLVALAAQMRGSVLIDGRNMLDPAQARTAGLRYDGIGRPG